MKQRYSFRSNAVKFRLLTLTLLALLCLGGNRAWAWHPTSEGTYYLRSTGTGNSFNVFKANSDGSIPTDPTESNCDQLNSFTITSGTYTLVFENTSTIIMNGRIFIDAAASTEAKLHMQLGTGASAKPTLKITGNEGQSQAAFFINSVANTDRTKHVIIIEGNDPSANSPENISNYVYDFNNNFVIDGDGPVMTAIDDGTSIPQMKVTTAGNRKSYGLFRIQEGTLQLKNVTVQNFATTWGNGGVIQVYTGQSNNTALVDVDHCHFKSIASKNEIVLKVQSNGTYNDQPTSGPNAGLNAGLRDAKFKNCKIEYTFGCEINASSVAADYTQTIGTQNGTFRSIGNNSVTISLENCHLTNNYGCPVRWHGSRSKDKLIVDHCKIENNYTLTGPNVNGGGGLLLKGPAQISQCTIQKNRTNGDGGGIYLSTYTDFGGGTSGLVPDHSLLELDANTLIDQNIAALNGGGVAIDGVRMRNTQGGVNYPNGPNGYIWYNPDGDPFKLKFVLGGATISNNKALGGNGGGVWIYRNKEVTYYKVECELDKGTISGNQSSANGGGVAIITPDGVSNPTDIPTHVKPQNVDVTIGTLGSSNQVLIKGNKAVNGGGIYVKAYKAGYNGARSEVNVSVYDYADIQENIANYNSVDQTYGLGGGLYVDEGDLTIQGNATYMPSFYNNTSKNNGGGIYVKSGTVTMLSTLIQHNKANSGSGGGLYVGGGDVFINPNEIGTGIRSKISDNEAGLDGGGVYTGNGKLIAYGSFSESGAQSNHIEITNNKALGGNGGGIYCQGTLNSQSWEYDIRLRRVDIGNNYAKFSGGGVYLYEGKISVIDGAINGNTADKYGGGVYTENGNIDINATRDERFASEIMGNTAGINGGGLNTHKGYIRIFGTSKDQRIPIANNVATTGSGGGIFCMGEGASNQYITMQHADLINNKAVKGGGNAGTGVVAGCGGGMYLQKGKIAITDVNLQNNYAVNNGGGINNHEGSIDVDGCFIGSSHSDGGSYYCDTTLTYNSESPGNTDRGNEAGNNGGGIYTHKGDIDIEDYVLTSGNIFREESKITFNEAGKNGGGINTHMGTIYINTKEEDDQIEVAFNRANKGGGMYANAGTIIAHNALIHDNTATLNGGGANNHSGDIRFYGGSLSNNTAEKGHGGGAYTNVGDIDLFQFPSTNLMNPTLNDGMKVFNNIAKINGGAFNNHTGRVDVRHATLYNNTATNGNGGAIFCEGPHANSDKGLGYTIRLLYSDMVQNKTRGQDGTATDPTGRGGGIYLKYGSIFAHYSNILNNSANINGGGIDNHSGNILLYGCNVQENQAVTGNGGGIFTYAGDITIGPSTARDGISTTSNPTIITLNTAKQDGGGINNQQGNITINGDIVANNEALEGNGGGVYIADGIIDMNGGRIDYNKADNGQGGGVWSGGGEFNIKDRNATPEPIVLIVDSEVKRGTSGQTATIHYHLIDQGKYTDVTNVEHGIIWGEDSPNTEVVYNDTEGHQPAPYFCKQGEPACQRITIPAKTAEQTSIGIEANKTYKVKAFFRYKTIENGAPVIKTGYSETMEFVTYSSKPLVLSGTVSNITSTSAEGSGKIMDTGDSPIITPNGRGVEIWQVDDNGNMIGSAKRIPSTDETDFFTVDTTGLQPDKTYKARAYATNSHGTSYGNTVEFKTLKNTPDMGNNPVIVTTDIVNGVIVATAEFSMPTGTAFGGTNGVKAFGFVWSTDDDPELLQDHTVQCTQSSITHDTTFTASYSPVRPNLTFYVRAFASYNETSVTPTSDITNFSVSEPTQHISPSLDGSPVVRANSISNITQNGANIHGQLHYEGSSAVTEYGVVYSPNIQEPAIPTGTATDPIKVSVSDSPGTTEEFTVPISGLTPGTTYYLRVYAVNAADTAYSNNFNFTALPISQPNVVIVAIDNITKGSAQVHCSVNNGGGTVTDWGIKYSTNSNMSGATNWRKPGGGDHLSGNTFTVSIDNANHDTLASHTTYYVQAYATNSAGTHTCQTVSFQTDFDKPSVVLNSLTNLTSIALPLTSDAVYTVTPYSSGESDHVKTYGICWSTLHNPTRNNSDVANTHFQDGTGGDITTATPKTTSMTQRFPNTRYWARAYASTATPNDNTTDLNPENHTYSLADIVYSDERAFLTKPIMQSTGVSNINSTSATLAGNIASRDPQHYLIKYGVCWGTDENPVPNFGYNPETETANYADVVITSASSTTRPFSFNVTGLGNNTPYHYRAYAINRNGKEGTVFAFAKDSIAYGPDVEFVTTPYTITATANPASAGSVAYTSGLTSGGGWDGSATFTLTASANTDWQFKNWTRDDETTTPLTGNPLTQTSSGENPDVNANDHTYLANFQARVSVAANGTGRVGITADTVVITDQEEIEAYIDLDTIVTVTATPTPESSASFLYWTDAAGEIIKDDDGEPVEDTYTFPLSAPVSLTAHFSIRTISVSANPSEGGTVTGAGAYLIGETCTVTATQAAGYVFSNWTEDGTEVSTSATYSFTVSGNRTLVANFTRGGRGASRPSHPRDIYPAPAREPWDWDDDLRDGEPTVPTVTTGEVTFSVDMQVINAVVSGNTVTELGAEGEDATLVEAGIWYSTINGTYDATNNLGTFVAATSPVVGEAYSVAFPELTIGQTYYARAYAKNNKVNDYGFGEAITIVFNSPSVATLSALSFVGESRKAILKGKVTNAGSTGLTQVGVWYSTSSQPYDATSNQGTFIEVSPRPTVNTVYSATIDDGLSGGETYYVRAYATNNNGVTYSFGDPIQLFNPTVATGEVSIQTPTSATVAGTVTGSAEGAEAGVWYSFTGNEYDEDANPGIFKQATIGAGGTISVGLTGLLADQTYYIRAYASNDNKASISFGDAKTHKFSNPKVETVGVSNLPEAGVTVSGKVTENGSLPEDLSGVTAGVWYSTKGGDYNPQMNKGYFVSGPSNPDLNLNTEYSVELPGTGCPAWGSDSTYHARAYLNIGTDESPNYVFGNSIRFSKDNVVLVTGDITNVTGNSATVKGMVESLGQYAIGSVEAGIWWSKEGPTYDASSNQGHFIRVPEETTIEVGTEYTVELTGLQGFNQYVRAYAKVAVNSGGDGEGKDDPTYNYFFGNLATIYTNSPSVSYNTSDYGGGIYMTNSKPNTPTKLVFSGPTEPNPTDHGIINYNYASEAGGGIYIDKSAYMQMKGHCEVNANRVPEGKRGGGIYLDGRLYVGEGKDDAAGTHGLIVNKNYAINATDADFAANYSAIANGTASADISDTYKKALNNVFLTRYESDFVLNWDGDHASHDDDATVITLLSDISGKDTGGKPYTNIGFHVLRGFCPVVATSDAPWGSYVNTAEDNDKSIYENWLYSLMGNNSGSSSGSESSGLDANGALFEDTETYVAIHVRKHVSPPFLPKYIYLWGCWTYPAVNEDPEDLNPMTNNQSTTANFRGHYKIVDKTNGILTWEIYSEEGLSWFSSYVNGLNTFTPDTITTDDPAHDEYEWRADKNPYAKATLMNDLDMSSHIWTPIGSVTTFNAGNIGHEQSGSTDGALFFDDPTNPHHFKGSFDGQGHIIRGVNVRYVTGIYKYGLFGYLDEGASVKNVFVDESNFITDDPSKSYTVGGIAGLVQAYGNNNTIVISGSEARVEVDITAADKATSYVGGLVGNVADGTDANHTVIHSSMAMPEVIGAVKYMGGLVGYLGSNDSLVNSFSNPKFPDDKYADTIRTGVSTITDSIYFGGLVGINNGTVENCYSRLQGTEPIGDGKQTGKSIFGWLAGTNTGTIQYSYALQPSPEATRIYVRKTTSPGNNAPSGHGTYGPTTLYSGKYGFKHRDQQMYDKDGTTIDDNKYATNSYSDYLKYKTTNDTLIVGGLTNALNAWVIAKKTAKRPFESWTRTMASPINDDYPIPMLTTKGTNEKFNSVGSKDGIYLLYEDNINDMWSETGKNFQAVNGTPGNAAMFLYDVQPLVNVSSDPESPVLKPCDVTISGNTNVPLYIHEDIGITQGDGNLLTARVGVTFDNSNRSPLPELGGQPYDWHMFSSALNKPSMGLRYHTDAEAGPLPEGDGYPVWADYDKGYNYLANGIPDDENHYNGQVPGYNRLFMDPPRTYFYQSDDDQKKGFTTDKTKFGYFPVNTPYGTWRDQPASSVGGSFDFYMYGEAHYQHWINFKRRGDADFYDHWRQDATEDGRHLNIPYTNETEMVNGRGYMMGVSQRSMLMADGTLNNGDITYNATFTVDPSATVYDELVRGTNLIGNPYQSYLDANKFFTANVDVGGIYYIFDADNGGYIAYPKDASLNPVGADQMIHPHQGFFVKVPNNMPSNITTITFNKDMRVAGKGTSGFRDERLNYPLVNLLCYDSRNLRDYTTVEINRPEVGGGAKMKRLRCGNAIIYARYDQTDYQTVFTPVGISEVPVRMEVFNDDVFTMRWSTLHGDFHYLHLIDNMTGSDIDMLRATEYHFEGKTTDYKSRFKLVFEVTGLEEEDDNEDDNGSTINFAFRMGDEIIVNGEGYFELFDMQGRCLTAKHLAGAQSSVSLPNVAAGVYLLRLTGDKQVKTQKMVISY